jgi:hypothetical protein
MISGGKSQADVRPTSMSAPPAAHTISVRLGASETTRTSDVSRSGRVPQPAAAKHAIARTGNAIVIVFIDGLIDAAHAASQ